MVVRDGEMELERPELAFGCTCKLAVTKGTFKETNMGAVGCSS